MKNKNFLLILGSFLFIILLISLYSNYNKKENKFTLNSEINHFKLLMHDGKKLDENFLLSTPSIFFFGFSNCPDICPDTLIRISDIISKLDKKSKKLKFYFVTVDPERDTVNNIKEYLENFNSDIIGVTGTSVGINSFLKYMYVYNKKIILEDGYYTYDHSAQIYLFDKNGLFFGTVSPGENIDNALKKILKLINGV